MLPLYLLCHESVHYFLKVVKEQISPFVSLALGEQSFDFGLALLHLKPAVLTIRRLLLKVGETDITWLLAFGLLNLLNGCLFDLRILFYDP